MTIVICTDKKGRPIFCDYCYDENLLKDPFCLGDYNREGTLQSFCKKCGAMYPCLCVEPEIAVSGFISKNLKKRTGKRFVKVNQLDYKKMNKIINEDLYDIEDADDFAFLLSAKINEVFGIETEKADIIRLL